MPIPLRTDYDAGLVRIAAKKTKDGPQARRLLALAAIYEGASRTEAARIGGVTVQIVRDWVVKFNTDGPAGLIDRKPPGTALTADRGRPCRGSRDDRQWTDPGGARRGAMAHHRPLPMVLGGTTGPDRQADLEPRTAPDGVSQAVGPAAASCPGARCDRGF
jgi:hypothetical protein